MAGLPRPHRFRGQTGTGTGPRKEILVTPARCTSLRCQHAENHSSIRPGEQPEDPLVLATDGNFYGTTEFGGTSAEGSVFKITPSGTLTVIYPFDKTHGLGPYSPLIQGEDGNFYGTTSSGGSASGGVVFKLTLSGKIQVLYNFTQGTSPSVLYGGLVQATDGLFYGTTSQGNSTGGTISDGTIFRIGGKPGSPSYLYNFDGTTGALPEDTLLQHTNGILYGDTLRGGDPSSGCGVFYGWNAGLNPFVSLVFTSAKVGKTVQILGQKFTGTTGVSFNGVVATFTIVSDTFLTAVVPTGATTGSVVVTTPGGTLTSNKIFRVTPQILSFSPPSGAVGTAVTITGVSLTQTTKVTFGGVTATTFAVISDTQVTATVPTGGKTGKIGITTRRRRHQFRNLHCYTIGGSVQKNTLEGDDLPFFCDGAVTVGNAGETLELEWRIRRGASV